jgi:hypothetical protein
MQQHNNHETASSLDRIQTKSFLNEGQTTVGNLMIVALLTGVYVEPFDYFSYEVTFNFLHFIF